MNRINRLELTAHLFIALHPQFSFRVEHKSPTPKVDPCKLSCRMAYSNVSRALCPACDSNL
jgi:hypothetical protein